MNKKQKYSFLLGSGFSAPAKIAGVKELNSAIMNPEASIPDDINNEHIEDSRITALLFFTEFIEWYKNYWLKNNNFDYEQLFDDMAEIGKHPTNEFVGLLSSFIKKKPRFRKLYDPFGTDFIHIESILDFIIKNKLSISSVVNLKNTYKKPLDAIRTLSAEGHPVCIHTLNHDLLLEELLRHENLQYDDGFSFVDNWYIRDINSISEDRTPVANFDNTYVKPIRIYKLHGSINYNITQPAANGITFKGPVCDVIGKLYRGENATEPENTSFYMGLFFLTGKQLKIRQYPRFNYSAQQLENFRQNLSQSDTLIVIGYGFKDDGINELIKESNKHILIFDINRPDSIPVAESGYTFIKKCASQFSLHDITR